MIIRLKKFLLSKWPIRVHSWGGLGSQLFACLVARRLISKFPSRNIILVFHSSGVTYRGIELNCRVASMFRIEFRDDYIEEENLYGLVRPRRKVYQARYFLVRFLERIGVIARLNEEYDFDSLSILVSEVRGHYTGIRLVREEINWVVDVLQLLHSSDSVDKNLSQISNAIHLRLGDLLHLTSKTHTSAKSLSRAASTYFDSKQVHFYSDSPKDAVTYIIKDDFKNFELEIHCIDAISTIRNCLRARVFIGTNSKISLWISLIRVSLGIGENTVLPHDLANNLSRILDPTFNFGNVHEY